MRAVSSGLWVRERDWMGLRQALRTTFVRMGDGRLFVHSPTELDSALRDQLAELGPVGCLVAANNHHHRWLCDWQAAYPDAAVFVSRAVPHKRRTLSRYALLEHTAAPPWRDVLDQTFMAGVPFFDETVFFHHASGSLIVTDFIQNHSAPEPIGFAARLCVPIFARVGFTGVCLAPPLRLRWLRRDPQAFRAFLLRVAAWPVQRIIVTHGAIIEQRADEHLRAALRQAGSAA